VTYLLDAIECNDAPLQAAMALVRNDTGATGKMNDFEATASFILPHCPIAKKQTTGNKRPDVADVSDATGTEDNGKVGIGSSGVELRYYDLPAYKALSKEQKDELREYRNAGNETKPKGKGKPAKGKGKGKGRGEQGKGANQPTAKKMKTIIAEAVAKEVASNKESESSSKETEKQLHEYLVSLVEAATGKKVKPSASISVAEVKEKEVEDSKPEGVTLQKILKRVQFKKDSKS
jgi:hypothetical protein